MKDSKPPETRPLKPAASPRVLPEKATPAQKAKHLCNRLLTRSVTPEQIMKDGPVTRVAEVAEVRAIDEDKRTVELAFSSEAEVERFFGIEVLSHDQGAMRTERLENGAALLINHDWDDQVGVVESVSIGADRRGRAIVRFGKGAWASEVWQDVVDDIRRHVSVGYTIHRVEVEERKGMPDMVRVTDWEPHEISIVSVPADVTVGVGRSVGKTAATTPEAEGQTSSETGDHGARSRTLSDQRGTDSMKEKILRDASGNLVRAKVDDEGNIVEVLEMLERAGEAENSARSAGAQAEQKRVKALMDMGRQYGETDLAMQHVSEGKSPEELQRALLEKLSQDRGQQRGLQHGAGGGGQQRTPSLGNQGEAAPQSAQLGLSDTEVRRYSMMNVIRALANPNDRRAQDAAAFEMELSQEAERQYGRTAQGVLIPHDVLARAFNAGGAADTPVGAQTGQNLVDTQYMAGSFIDMLRNRTVLMRLATTMTGLVGNVEVPKQTGGASAYWVGEHDDVGEGTPGIGQIGLTPNTVGAFTDITRRLMMQSTPDAEAIVRRDLAAALALAIDLAGFYGTGVNQPTGIANVNGINAVDFAGAASGGGSALPTYAEAVQMESEISADNADVNAMAYVMASGMRGHFKTSQKFDGTNGAPIWEPGNTVNGYRAEVTNQVLAGDLFFGNFADLIIGMWGGLDLKVDPYTLSKSGGTRVVALQDVDTALRRVESFCLGRDAS
ncbi:phage major capsid protein [Halomonas sp. V046]|uniref:phage major capsid protein n=1 Tax=Halomonas sp. V046 TaxID=3459611 RepID=UPI004043A281